MAYTTICPGRRTDPKGKLIYYERWRVKNWKPAGGGWDKFSWLKGFGRFSKSVVANYQKGEVAFYRGPNPPPGNWAKKGQGNHVDAARDLETTCNAPGWPYGRPVQLGRSVFFEWDCCCDRNENFYFTTELVGFLAGE